MKATKYQGLWEGGEKVRVPEAIPWILYHSPGLSCFLHDQTTGINIYCDTGGLIYKESN